MYHPDRRFSVVPVEEEYAVFRNRPDEMGQYTQVDGLTVGWMGRAEALQRIQRITHGEFAAAMAAEHLLTVESSAKHGSCGHCD